MAAAKGEALKVQERLNNIHGALALAALVAWTKSQESEHSGRTTDSEIETAGWSYLFTVMQGAFWDQRAVEEAIPLDVARSAAPGVEPNEKGAA